jgi:hypothetical protein
MKKKVLAFTIIIGFCCVALNAQNNKEENKELKVWKLPNLQQAAEAYFSPDGKYLICNAQMPGDSTYGVYKVSIDGKEIIKINGLGEDA